MTKAALEKIASRQMRDARRDATGYARAADVARLEERAHLIANGDLAAVRFAIAARVYGR